MLVLAIWALGLEDALGWMLSSSGLKYFNYNVLAYPDHHPPPTPLIYLSLVSESLLFIVHVSWLYGLMCVNQC